MADEIKIFFSWQSDLPNSSTRGLIQSSIDAAVKGLRNTVEVDADRDTKGTYGSPDIVQTIFEKIDDCDVFVADVSGVTTYHPLDNEGNPTERLKMSPNPNVLLELGYAAQVIGWENIICIMNEDYAADGEIPFDIDHRRLTRYSLKDREKSDVRKELRDIIFSTVLNVMENGKRVRQQFSNISIGSWNHEDKSVSKNLIPYNVYESASVKTMLDKLIGTAGILLENIQSAKVRRLDELPEIDEYTTEENNDKKEKIITKYGVELTPASINCLMNFNKWNPVKIQEKEKTEIVEEIKTYFDIEVGADFFDFGGLKRKISIVPGFAAEYDGTEDEKKKYDDYIEFRYTICRIQIIETYRKTFDGLILLPLAAKNESSVSDSDIYISIQIDDSTAEVVYPTSELICDELKGIEGEIYEDGLVEMIFVQGDTVDIKDTKDDRFWSIEDQQGDMKAVFRSGINGQPRHSSDDYVRELSRYVASPEDGNPTVFSFHISSLHAKAAKWLSHTIILRPLTKTIKMRYSIKSSKSDGNLEGILELTV